MRKNKGQAALEYLTTYGFALVIIAIVVGVLVFMGILNAPSAEYCTGSQFLAYNDHTMDHNGYFSLYLANGTGYRITELEASFSGDFSGQGAISANTVLEGNFFKVSGQTTKKAGDTYKGEITVSYKRGRYGRHYEKITCVGKASQRAAGTELMQPDANTVALWHFNEGSGDNLFDATSNHNDCLLWNPANVFWVSGAFGGGLEFISDPGGNLYSQADCGNGASLNITDKITVEAWINPDAIVQDRSPVGKFLGGLFEGYGVWFGPEKIRFSVENNLSSAYKQFPSSTYIGKWSYIVGTYDGNYIRIYVDGAEGTAQAYTGPINPALTKNLYIGSGGGGTSTNFDGKVDELAVHNRALSASEISERWSKGQSMLG
ncbi:MAG: LamG domain-containing protein [Candidatus Diapherotrites archaeon]|nr:LamG domain-containing protein [Candidatus Diapherotrites archaeon]